MKVETILFGGLALLIAVKLFGGKMHPANQLVATVNAPLMTDLLPYAGPDFTAYGSHEFSLGS